MATTYTATHAGFTWKRKTDRTYSHAVIAFRSLDRAVENARAWAIESHKRGAATRREVLAGTCIYKSLMTAENIAECARLEAMTAEQYGEEAAEKMRAEHAADLARGLNGTTPTGWWCAPTFCGRADLANKEAVKASKHGAMVVIVPAVAK